MSNMAKSSLENLLNENTNVFFKELNEVIKPTFKGLENPEKYDDKINILAQSLQRPLFPRQARLVSAAMQHFEKEKSLILSAEMGVGKTSMALAIALESKFKVNFIMCPPHLVSKWADEIRTVYRDSLVDYKIVIVSRWEDLVPYTGRNLKKEGHKYFFIFSREAAKLSYKKVHSFVTKSKFVWKEELLDGESVEYKEKEIVKVCPRCFNPLEEEIENNKRKKSFPYKCSHKEIDADGNEIEGSECGEVLRDVDRTVSKKMMTRLSIAEYLKKQWKKGSIDLLIVDEVHEYKGGDTGQGNAMAMLVTRAKKVVGLTGTLLNGYASSLFYILYRLNPHMMKNRLGLDYNQVGRFVEMYGAVEQYVEAEAIDNEGVVTKKGKKIGKPKEKAKISPFLLSLILDMTIFLRLDEIKMENDLRLPSYTESIETVEMDEEVKEHYFSYIANLTARIRNDKRFLGNLAMDSLSVCDLPYIHHSAHEEEFYEPMVIRNESERENDEQKVLEFTSKERKLMSLVESELNEGRRCLVYVHFSNKGVGDDINRILSEKFPNKVVNLLTAKIPAKKRQKWIEDNPCDILICNPELVKTGLDLLQFPTIIYFETGYNVFTLKQASRRSWRIGQREAIKVIFMAYANSPQQKALELIGAKVNAANSLEGRLSGDDDLSSLGEEEDNIQLALAKAILNGDMGKSAADIKTTSIESFGDREWDAFELHYKKLLAERIDKEAIEAEIIEKEAVEVEQKIEDEVVINKTEDKPSLLEDFCDSPTPKSESSFQLGFDFDDDSSDDDDANSKIIVYKRVRKGKRFVEVRMEMTKSDIDKQVNDAMADGETQSFQGSLF